MKLQDIFTDNHKDFLTKKNRSTEWKLLKEKYKNAGMEELIYLIMFMQVFGEDVVLDQMNADLDKAEESIEKMEMKFTDIEKHTGCIEIQMDGSGGCKYVSSFINADYAERF